jgi:ABC-type transport system substrate-binding protein
MRHRSPLLATAIAVSLLAVSGAGGSPTSTPKHSGAVVFGPISGFPCLNPLVADCSTGSVPLSSIIEKVVTPAFLTAPDFTLRPSLVSHVSYTRRPPFILTYEIRPEARWSDGVPVRDRDFVFTHRALVKYVSPDENSPFTDDLTMVRSVRALDPKTVRVVLPFILTYRKAVRNIVPTPTNLFWSAENWWLER